jgi:hypothetical protein
LQDDSSSALEEGRGESKYAKHVENVDPVSNDAKPHALQAGVKQWEEKNAPDKSDDLVLQMLIIMLGSTIVAVALGEWAFDSVLPAAGIGVLVFVLGLVLARFVPDQGGDKIAPTPNGKTNGNHHQHHSDLLANAERALERDIKNVEHKLEHDMEDFETALVKKLGHSHGHRLVRQVTANSSHSDSRMKKIDLHSRLSEFYAVYNPDHLPNVSEIVDAYIHHETLVWDRLADKYSTLPNISSRKLHGSSQRWMEARTKLVYIYARHAPPKVAKVDEILDAYRNHEDMLWKRLYSKYHEDGCGSEESGTLRRGGGREAENKIGELRRDRAQQRSLRLEEERRAKSRNDAVLRAKAEAEELAARTKSGRGPPSAAEMEAEQKKLEASLGEMDKLGAGVIPGGGESTLDMEKSEARLNRAARTDQKKRVVALSPKPPSKPRPDDSSDGSAPG